MDQHKKMTPDEIWAQAAQLLSAITWERSCPAWYPATQGSCIKQVDDLLPNFPMSAVPQVSVTIARDYLLHTVIVVRATPSESFGVPCALLRTGLETAALGYWVLKPDSQDERILRNLRWHYDNLREAGAVSSMGFRGAVEHTEMLIRDAALVAGVNLKSALVVPRMPEVLADVDRFADEADTLSLETMWRLASGFAHGKQWVYPVLAERGATAELGDGSRIAEQIASKGFQATLAQEVVELLGALVLRWRELSTNTDEAATG